MARLLLPSRTLCPVIFVLLMPSCNSLGFDTKSISQTMPFVSARNVLRVTLVTDSDTHLPGGSNITISGLTSSGTRSVNQGLCGLKSHATS